MFGLTAEKLVLVVLLAAFVVGPRRLPDVAVRIAHAVRSMRVALAGARTAVERDAGVPIDTLRAVDPRQYDPRRIIAAALRDDPPEPARRRLVDATPAEEGTDALSPGR